jgi:GNAT superfamily N-acetyltransferase
MALELVLAKPEHIPELGRICYEAFKDLADRHGFPTDFPSAAVARMVTGSLVQSESVYAVTAMVDGQVSGSNFLSVHDEVGGVGPISVEVPLQGGGLGRALMVSVMDHARESGLDKVRLMQDAFNVRSLALYASLGFHTRTPCAVMQPIPAEAVDATIRPVTEKDSDDIEELSRRLYKGSRRNEVAGSLSGPFRPFLRERNGRIVGYFSLGLAGHGVAETDEDALSLVRESSRGTPLDMARFFCPLTNASLYRTFLSAGCRNVKVMNLMTVGPYEEPEGCWLPSIIRG